MRTFAVIAAVAALVVAAPAAEAADRWDTGVFSLVPAPGYPANAYAHPNGRIYAGTYSNPRGDHEPSRVFEWTDDGTMLRSWSVPGQDLDAAHGVQVATSDAQGRLVLLEKSTARALLLDVRTGAVTEYATFADLPTCGLLQPIDDCSPQPIDDCSPQPTDEPAVPNFAAWGPDGSLYVTDYAQAVVWRVPPGGGEPKLWLTVPALAGGPLSTTGIALAADRRTLLITQQTRLAALDPTGALYAVPIRADGTPGSLRTVWRSRPLDLPDGFAITTSGRVYVALLAGGNPDFVAAFAQTNAGDMSPNLDFKTPEEQHEHEFEHTRDIGLRQYDAAAAQLTVRGHRLSGVDARTSYVNLSDVTVRPEFTRDGKPHKTCKPAIGAAMAAGSTEDNAAFPIFDEGENPLFDTISGALYAASPELKQCQSPKGILLPVGELNGVYPWVAEQVPVQLIRIGRLYLVGIPGEVTITAGLRIRRSVAERVGADVKDVLIAGYANGYIHYVTTPEEYDKQNYEGGSTLFGRWEQPALEQTAAELAGHMAAGEPAPLGQTPPDDLDKQLSLQPGVALDVPQLGKRFGDVLSEPEPAYRPGKSATAVFAGAHPNNDLHQENTYLEVQRWDGGTWRRIADDGDWSTKFRWARDGIAASRVTVTWDIPADASGRYRIRYHGDAKSLGGRITPFTGTTRTFTIG